MLRRRTVTLGVLVLALLLGLAPWARSQQPPVREITKIAGEVYRFRNANHYSVFAVTPAWGPKEWFPLNIEGMYRLVQANRRGN
jgi:hypothetical protein